MKTILLILAFNLAFIAKAQHYVTFVGSDVLDSVRVENMTTKETVTLLGGDVLYLKGQSGSTDIEDTWIKTGINIYPNPMTESATIELSPPVSGEARISVFDMSGQKVIQMQDYLSNNVQKLSISGLDKGFYLINVKSKNYQLSGKLISNGSGGYPQINRLSSENVIIDKEASKNAFKGLSTDVEMYYQQGDRLLITGISGENKRILTGVIDQDKLISFDFMPCTDANNNNYPVISIGTQYWMGENLRATKLSNGLDLQEAIIWSDYDLTITNIDSATYESIYGKLYGSPYEVCPVGWHIPNISEWTVLFDYLEGISRGNDSLYVNYDEIGGKLKETGTTHWESPNNATNEAGFTALPGDYFLQPFGGILPVPGKYAFFMTSSYGLDSHEYEESVGVMLEYDRDMASSGCHFGRSWYSVRCIKDK